MTKLLTRLILLAGLAIQILPAGAKSVSWKSGVNGYWHDASKWSNGQIPGPTDEVVIDQSKNIAIIIIEGRTIINGPQSVSLSYAASISNRPPGFMSVFANLTVLSGNGTVNTQGTELEVPGTTQPGTGSLVAAIESIGQMTRKTSRPFQPPCFWHRTLP